MNPPETSIKKLIFKHLASLGENYTAKVISKCPPLTKRGLRENLRKKAFELLNKCDLCPVLQNFIKNIFQVLFICFDVFWDFCDAFVKWNWRNEVSWVFSCYSMHLTFRSLCLTRISKSACFPNYNWSIEILFGFADLLFIDIKKLFTFCCRSKQKQSKRIIINT